jgi:selenide,water dikinase
LIGHLQEMAQGSGVAVRLQASRIPVLPGARELVENGVLNPGIAMNQSSFGSFVKLADADQLTKSQQALVQILYESQNSGGLLMAVAAGQMLVLQSELAASRITAAEIGEVIGRPAGQVIIEF